MQDSLKYDNGGHYHAIQKELFKDFNAIGWHYNFNGRLMILEFLAYHENMIIINFIGTVLMASLKVVK